jgi:cytidyltransferase-like protein
MNIVYSYYVLDLIHPGHILMMKNSKAIAGPDGRLIVGILTDQAVKEKKKAAILNFSERLEVANAIKYIDLVVPQENYSPLQNIKQIKPDVLMESASHDENDIIEVREFMKNIGGKVIMLPYYPFQSSSDIKAKIKG